MANPRYQVFISSTFLDLKEARQEVLHALLDLDCIPAGMELFSASSEEQFEYIKQEIDETDYYVLILGWRYGSVHKDGVSYTEREFDYAVERGIPILVFAHADENAVPEAHREPVDERRARLLAFRERAMQDRMAKHWTSPGELSIQVNKSLAREFRSNPRIGWIRADSGPDADTLAEINRLLRENKALSERIVDLEQAFPKVAIPNLAPLSASFDFRYSYKHVGYIERYEAGATRTFQEIFAIIAPSIVGPLAEEMVGSRLARAVEGGSRVHSAAVDEADIETLRVQFVALGLITADSLVSTGRTQHIYWKLTAAGTAAMLTLRTVKQ